MKVFVGIFLSTLLVQALAKPTPEDNFNAAFSAGFNGAEHGVEFKPLEPQQGFKAPLSQVDDFRQELEQWFSRYQRFYERTSSQVSVLRLNHVDQITDIYNHLMRIFGEDIEAIRLAGSELRRIIQNERNELGEENACLEEIAQSQAENSRSVSSTIQQCAIFANTTLNGLIQNLFYPTLVQIQNTASYVPVQIVNVLSRGNLLEDEQSIIEYLRAQFEVYDMQWTTAVEQLLNWEINRFGVDGLFLVDEMTECMSGSVIEYIATNSRLESQVRTCRDDPNTSTSTIGTSTGSTPPTTTDSTTESTTTVTDESSSTTVQESTTSAVEESTTSTIQESTTSAVEESTTSAVEESTTSVVEESTTSAVEESTTSAVEESTTSAMEESTTAAVEESTTTAVEESTTSTVEESTTSPVEESSAPSTEDTATTTTDDSSSTFESSE